MQIRRITLCTLLVQHVRIEIYETHSTQENAPKNNWFRIAQNNEIESNFGETGGGPKMTERRVGSREIAHG
jgi:hypothetical protein